MNPVREFHEKFGVTASPFPRAPSVEDIRLRMGLIREEFKEVMAELELLSRQQATNAGVESKLETLRRLLKELADLRYVVDGTAVTCGLDIDGAFLEIHASNMSKLGTDGRPIRNQFGKVLKGPNYREANMEKFVPLTIEST